MSRLRFDRMHAEQLTANLARRGVRPVEYVFCAAGADRLARALYGALRDRAVELPDDAELVSEATTVRMVETGPGRVKMSNPTGTHDDVLTAVGMVVADLAAAPEVGRGGITVPRAVMPSWGERMTARSVVPTRAQLRIAVRTRGQHAGNALLVSGSANDPRRQGA